MPSFAIGLTSWSSTGPLGMSAADVRARIWTTRTGGWQFEAEWVRASATADVRVNLQVHGAWSAAVRGELGSYPGFFVGPTFAFGRDPRAST